ncbi:hypothetical protein FA15DRAFT_660512 [Coprinopsis marcescibilis]|uniref:Uncharacterized protein n=1 Tax=Coprinopsis marcescibilis TaxID=230819 RepID=A0A5C3KFL8_COPMA|nr:hypothetical protein FA15DRAFT_660512 [Coprinopsis marcescibilis]
MPQYFYHTNSPNPDSDEGIPHPPCSPNFHLTEAVFRPRSKVPGPCPESNRLCIPQTDQSGLYPTSQCALAHYPLFPSFKGEIGPSDRQEELVLPNLHQTSLRSARPFAFSIYAQQSGRFQYQTTTQSGLVRRRLNAQILIQGGRISQTWKPRPLDGDVEDRVRAYPNPVLNIPKSQGQLAEHDLV